MWLVINLLRVTWIILITEVLTIIIWTSLIRFKFEYKYLKGIVRF
jgi:hypothetical protein